MPGSRRENRRPSWWRRLRPLWLAYQWKVVLVASVVSIAMIHLGVNGAPWRLHSFQHTLEVLAIGRPVGDSRLAMLGSFFFTAVALFTLWSTWRVVFAEQRQYSRLWRLADHTIVCGFGDKGRYIAAALAADGGATGRVVVIEAQANHRGLEQRRRSRQLTLIGDATDVEALRLAGAERARYVVALASDDDTNAEIATTASIVSRGRRQGQLTCIVHLDDPVLFRLIRERELANLAAPRFRLQCFNVHETGARAWLDAYPPPAAGGTVGRVVVVGFGRLGQSLVLEMARRWWFERPVGAPRLAITVLDPEASIRIAALEVRHPALPTATELRALDVTVHSREFEEGRFLEGDVAAVYVCLPEASEAITAALAVRARLRGRHARLVVRVARPEGLAALVETVGEQDSRPSLHLFPLIPATCGTAIVTNTTVELLARAFHADYVRDELRKARGQEEDSMRPWTELSEFLRESNRRKADHVCRQVSSLGYELLPLTDWTVPPIAFTPDEIERLAAVEHERWVADYRAQGWRHGATRDPAARTHQDLVEWAALGAEARDKNRAWARDLPLLLARLGFRICPSGGLA